MLPTFNHFRFVWYLMTERNLLRKIKRVITFDIIQEMNTFLFSLILLKELGILTNLLYICWTPRVFEYDAQSTNGPNVAMLK